MVLINQDTRRMMSTREVQMEVQAGVLPRETLVWRAGMSAWQSIASIAELAVSNSRPTVPRAKAAVGWDAPLAQTPRAGHGGHDFSRPTAPNPQLMLELVATGAAVMIVVLITSYILYSAGAFQAGGGPHGAEHGAAPSAGTEAKAAAH